jgi:tripartite-type tricarboxylate transporter receptor subunit TctC
MKKLLFLTLFSLFLNTHAETVQIIWPFGMGDTQAQYSRSLVDELNKNQKKYTFIFENKPGAGATIGARYVASNNNAVLSASTAFFVRPNFYPEESHSTNDFQPLMTQCAAPMIIVSRKYSNWKEVNTNAPINIGISGLGATSHLMAMEIKKRYPNAVPIPYKGTREASIDAANGNLDMSVAFIGEVEGLLDEKKLYALGISGTKSMKNIPTLESQGFAGVGEVVNMHSLIVPKTMPEEQYNEVRNLVTQAAKAPTVQRAYSIDYCDPSNLTQAQTRSWYAGQVAMWHRLSQGVKIDNK